MRYLAQRQWDISDVELHVRRPQNTEQWYIPLSLLCHALFEKFILMKLYQLNMNVCLSIFYDLDICMYKYMYLRKWIWNPVSTQNPEFMLISLELFLSNKIINFSLSVAFVSFFSYLKRFCNDYNCECKI